MRTESTRFDWTEDRKNIAMTLWADGCSASHIARRLGGGLSRSAVIGKLHRMGVPLRRKTIKSASLRRGPRKLARPVGLPPRRYKSPARRALEAALGLDSTPIPPPHELDIPRKTLNELDDKDCRFPCTSEPPHKFCASPRVPGLAYCKFHALRCSRPLDPVDPSKYRAYQGTRVPARWDRTKVLDSLDEMARV